MEWLTNLLSNEPLFISLPIIVIIGVFIYAARRAHLKHKERIKRIDETYNPKATFNRR